MKKRSHVPMVLAALSALLVLPNPVMGAQDEAPPARQAETSSGGQANASDLIREAQRAVGQVVKTAREDKALNPDAADAKPFWEAMKSLNESLDKADTGLTLKDQTFFSSLAMSVAAVQQAEIALEMNESRSPALQGAMSTLSGVVTTLNENYSKEAARLAQGGPLTDAERRQLNQLKAQQDSLEKKLRVVEENAAKNSESMKKGLEKIRENSKKIKNARSDGAGFAAAMLAANLMSGFLWGWHWWWGPWGYWCPGFIDVHVIVWDDWGGGYDYDWDLADEYVDTGDLGLDELDVDEADIAAGDEFLEQGDYGLDDADMTELTEELPAGWDEVDTDVGAEVMDGMQSNFEHVPYEPEVEMNTFDDVGFDDFGGGFDDFGGGFDDF